MIIELLKHLPAELLTFSSADPLGEAASCQVIELNKGIFSEEFASSLSFSYTSLLQIGQKGLRFNHGSMQDTWNPAKYL